jgi:zinc protease
MRRGLWAVILGLALFGSFVPSAEAQAPEDWPQDRSDIAADPETVFGRLDNGLRYALRRGALPPGEISIRLSIDFGSLYESEEERGLAHFIEHMAFNGSTNAPEGELVARLERLGLALGPDTNASTSLDHTVYSLNLPRGDEARLGEALSLLRDIASELTFDPAAIERERGVVMAEYRRGDTFVRRRSDQQLAFLLPGALAAARSPIGGPDVIAGASREAMRSLYDRYYRPERALIVIVGDVSPETAQRSIVRWFSDWRARGPAGKAPDAAYRLQVRAPEASVFVHEDGGDGVLVYSLSATPRRTDTAASRREAGLIALAAAALNRRLATIAASPDPPFRAASVRYWEFLSMTGLVSGSVSVRPGAWSDGVQALEAEWRRALLYGFSQDEIDAQVAALRNAQDLSARREGARSSGLLADQLLSAIQNDQVFTSPSSGAERLEAWLGDANARTVHEALRTSLSISTPLFFVSASRPEPGLDQAVVKAWEASASIDVAPSSPRPPSAFAYQDFGAPGDVVEDHRLTDVDARSVRFANNVYLTVKSTDFQKDVVQVSIRVGDGEMALQDGPVGLGRLMSAFVDGGLEAHSADDLRALTTGRAVQSVFGVSASAFGGTYVTTASDLPFQLQIVAAFLSAPGWRIDAQKRWRESVELSTPSWDGSPASVLATRGMRYLASGDIRFGLDPADGVASRTFDELKAVLSPILRTGPVEIAIVGDVDEDQAVKAVASTFGALPLRSADFAPSRSARPARFTSQDRPKILGHGGEPDQAMVQLFWPVSLDPDTDVQDVRVLSVLASVMQLQLVASLREGMGVSYAPVAGASVSSAIPDWGYLFAGAEIRPEDASVVAAAIAQAARRLGEELISEDEFRRALAPRLQQLSAYAASNAYWLSVLAQAHSRPERLSAYSLETVEAGLRDMTREDLLSAARKWLKPEAERSIWILPEIDAPAPGRP